MSLDSSEASRRRSLAASTGQFGMLVVLVSISVLFVAAALAVLITHHQAKAWRAPESTGLPWGALASTALLAGVSWQLQAALLAIRSNRFVKSLQHWRQAFVVACLFLVAQAFVSRQLQLLEGAAAGQTLFVFCYNLLVGLHAAHVLGGFVPLALVQARLARRDYSSSRHDGVTFCVQYWHYLGVVWLLLLGVLAWVG